MAPTGTIRQHSVNTFSWDIEGLYQLVRRQDLGVHSPDFVFKSTSWDIAMYKTAQDAVHFTNFSLWRKSYSVLRSRLLVNYRLYIKDQQGKQFWWSAVASNEFDFEKREGTPQVLRDVDVLGYIYWNTTSNVFSLYVTFDSAEPALVRAGSLRMPRRKSFLKDVIKRRGSFTQFENENSVEGTSSGTQDDEGNQGRVYSSSFSTSHDYQKQKRKESIFSGLKRRVSAFNTTVSSEGFVVNHAKPELDEQHSRIVDDSQTKPTTTAKEPQNLPPEEFDARDLLEFSIETIYQKGEHSSEQKNYPATDGNDDTKRESGYPPAPDSGFSSAVPQTDPEIDFQTILMKINNLNVSSEDKTFQKKATSIEPNISLVLNARPSSSSSSESSSSTANISNGESTANIFGGSLAGSSTDRAFLPTADYVITPTNALPIPSKLTNPGDEASANSSSIKSSSNHQQDVKTDHCNSDEKTTSGSTFSMLNSLGSESSIENISSHQTKDDLPDVKEFEIFPDALDIQKSRGGFQSSWPFNSSGDQLNSTDSERDTFDPILYKQTSDKFRTFHEFPNQTSAASSAKKPIPGTASTASVSEIKESTLFNGTTKSSLEIPPSEKSLLPNLIIQQTLTKPLHLKNPDVTFNVKGRKMSVPKDILAAKSSILADLFQEQNSVVEVTDVDSYLFQEFIQYLCTGDKNILVKENVSDLCRLAHKYDVEDLKKGCQAFMAKNLDVGVFCDFLAAALHCGEPGLARDLSEFFANNMADVIVTRQWKRFLTENPDDANQLMVDAVAAKKMNSLTARLIAKKS